MLAVAALGHFVESRDGLGFRFAQLLPDHAAEVQKIAAAWNFRSYPRPDGMHDDDKYGFAMLGQDDAKEKILFVGDSHTQQYWATAAGLLAKEPGGASVAVMFAKPDFPPVLDKAVIADTSIRKVVFSYYWSYRYGSDKVDQPMRCCGDGKGGTVGAYTLAIKSPAEMARISNTIKSTAQALKAAGKDVYFVLDNPFGAELDPHSRLKRSLAEGIRISLPPPLSRQQALQRMEPVRSQLLAIARATHARVIDPTQYLCNKDVCQAFSATGDLLYKDYDHLSLMAAKNNIHYLDPIFAL